MKENNPQKNEDFHVSVVQLEGGCHLMIYSGLRTDSDFYNMAVQHWRGNSSQSIHSVDGCGSVIYWDKTEGILVITNQNVLDSFRQRTSLAMTIAEIHLMAFDPKNERESFLEINDCVNDFHVQILENLLTNLPKK